MRHPGATLANNIQFHRIHSRVLRRIIAKPFPPRVRPEHSKNAKNPEACTPTHPCNQRDGDRRRQRSTEPCAHEDDAVSAPAFTDRKPLRETSRCVRKSARLPCAKKKSTHNQ